MATRQKQAGISYIGVMVLILIIGSLLKVVSAVGPAYYDYYTIDKIIESLYRDGRTTNIDDFKRALGERFSINGLRDRSVDEFTYSMDGNSLIVDLDYEVRKNMTGNLDVIVHFKKTYAVK